MKLIKNRFKPGDHIVKIDWEGRHICDGLVVRVVQQDEAGQTLSVLTEGRQRHEYSHDLVMIDDYTSHRIIRPITS